MKLRGLPDSQRQRDYLDVLFGSAVVQNPGVDAASLAKNLWGDPSQNVDRIPKKHKKGVGTLTTSTALYSFECDAVLSGAAGIQLMGWHRGAAPMEQVSESTARNLAGDSFSVPLAALMQCALFWNPPPHRGGVDFMWSCATSVRKAAQLCCSVLGLLVALLFGVL